MKLTFAKAAAAVALTAAAAFAVPTAANADSYPPAVGVTGPGTVAPGGTATFTSLDGVFEPGELVTVTLTGENASGASLAIVQAAVQTANLGTVTANANGAATATVRLPANASGTYTVSFTAASLPAGVSTGFSVTAAGGSGSGGGLAATGLDSGSLLGLWVGGGALVLAGGAVAVGAAVHRQRKNADA